jgi:hypothetical protein
MSGFSGKLSSLMTHSEDSAPTDRSTAAPALVPAPPAPTPAAASAPVASGTAPREVGGRDGPEPTRFGDWELRGRCIDF